MQKHNLVILTTTENLFWEGELFEVNKTYRCFTPPENGSDDNYMIFGEWFTQEEFDMYFEFAQDRVIRDWTEIGLVKDGKAIPFKLFKEFMDIHTYGKQNKNIRLGFVGVPRKNQYKFIPSGYDNKAIQLKQFYDKHYKETLNGNMIWLDEKIKLGCKGVPIGYDPN